jgi:8-oxo-dGTP pyrophosphatase MutT (NUDIX family)
MNRYTWQIRKTPLLKFSDPLEYLRQKPDYEKIKPYLEVGVGWFLDREIDIASAVQECQWLMEDPDLLWEYAIQLSELYPNPSAVSFDSNWYTFYEFIDSRTDQ